LINPPLTPEINVKEKKNVKVKCVIFPGGLPWVNKQTDSPSIGWAFVGLAGRKSTYDWLKMLLIVQV